MLRTSFGMSRVTLRFSTHFDRRAPSRFSAEVAPPPSRTRPLSLDGDMKQVRQTPLRVSPALRPHLAEHLRLRLGPERTRDLQGSSSLGCESHRLDAPVGVRNTLDHTIPLQEVEAPRQGRSVDGKRVLELPQIRGAHAGDRRENAELSYPQTARPQDVVVQLCHGPAHHAECIADACGQPSRVVSAHRSGASSIHDLMLSATSLTGKPLACRYILPDACGSIDFRNPASDGRRLKGQAEPRDMTDRRYDPNVTRSVQDPDVVAPQATVPRFDSRTVQTVGPLYGLFGLGMALYFASQGAGRLLWPLLANLTRLAIAAGGGWLALRWTGNLSHVFLALSAALAAFGLINAGAVASGAWFG